jgi:hypothetical protein
MSRTVPVSVIASTPEERLAMGLKRKRRAEAIYAARDAQIAARRKATEADAAFAIATTPPGGRAAAIEKTHA